MILRGEGKHFCAGDRHQVLCSLSDDFQRRIAGFLAARGKA